MKTKEIRDKSDDALKAELAERQKHLFDLRSQAVTEKLEDPSQLGKARKAIARIKTVIRQRQLEKVPGRQPPHEQGQQVAPGERDEAQERHQPHGHRRERQEVQVAERVGDAGDEPADGHGHGPGGGRDHAEGHEGDEIDHHHTSDGKGNGRGKQSG